ncbi:MAG: hypothetical protein ACRDD7_01330 [Peptostreptococcaceae bacterium]
MQPAGRNLYPSYTNPTNTYGEMKLAMEKMDSKSTPGVLLKDINHIQWSKEVIEGTKKVEIKVSSR